MQLRIQLFIGLFIVVSFLTACQQKQVIVTPSTTIRPIAPIKSHYETLQKLSTNTEASRNELMPFNILQRLRAILLRFYITHPNLDLGLARLNPLL